jgi:two-component system, chemotaxis family, chemotaxis protein CheY
MRILIVEDDSTSSLVLEAYLAPVGETQTAKDGEAGLSAFRDALQAGTPFDLVCLDIMMPLLDGQAVLKEIRALETEHRVPAAREVKVIMTTALGDKLNVVEAIPRCDAYLTKPIDRAKLMFYVKKFGLLDRDQPPGGQPAGKDRPHKDFPGKGGKDMPWVG